MSEYLYHVTYDGRLGDIEAEGLQPGKPRAIGTQIYDTHRKGAIFVTEPDGLLFWYGRAELWAREHSEDPYEDGFTPVVLRFDRAAYMKDCELDEPGTRDAGWSDAYRCETDVHPDDLELWDGSDWVSLEKGVDTSQAYDEDSEGEDTWLVLKDAPYYQPLYPNEEAQALPNPDYTKLKRRLMW